MVKKAALATCFALGLAPAAGLAQPMEGPPPPPTLTLTANGEAKAAPDMASLTVSIQTTGSSAAQAMARNAERAQRVIAALKAAGVQGADLQTTSIGLQPQMVYEQDKPPRLTGYQASNQLTATVRELARLGPVIDALAAAGASDIGQVSFGLANPAAAEAAARQAAVSALEVKAADYARATGYRIGRLAALTEGAPDAGPPQPRTMMAMRAAAAPTPVEAGEQTVHVDVTGVFELSR